MENIEDENQQVSSGSEAADRSSDRIVQKKPVLSAEADQMHDSAEEAIQRSMKPLESRTAIPATDTKHVNIDPASESNSNKESKKNDGGFVDVTNDAGEIE
jgi:hypothetical protein